MCDRPGRGDPGGIDLRCMIIDGVGPALGHQREDLAFARV
jgi:hypothetical protein